MPKFTLYIQATLENLENFRPLGDDYEWSFKVKCTSCGEDHDGFITFNAETEDDIPNSRGKANLVMKCKQCKALGNANIVKGTVKPYSKSGQLQPFVTIESRGISITDWQPTHGQTFSAENPDSGTKFEEIEFEEEERDWVGYDEKGHAPVSVMGLSWEIKNK
ncbi:hypothetical protein DFJ73DRAFT_75643 [Zopfochytrium polystomum]|nr:hypothetical protein DFJ73DRAFT_75643 [Zopfochytrium polystomum]